MNQSRSRGILVVENLVPVSLTGNHKKIDLRKTLFKLKIYWIVVSGLFVYFCCIGVLYKI